MIALVLAMAVSAEWRIDDPDWQPVYEEDGVEVYARDVPERRIREVKAERIVDVPAEHLWSVVTDTEHYAEFMPFVSESVVVERTATTQLFYQRLTPPIVSDRDVVLAITSERDERLGIFKATWLAVSDRGPAVRRGVVRLVDVRGQWMVERLSESASRLTYFAFIEPGGAIPRWMANRANKRGAPDAVLAVVHRASRMDDSRP
jgi:hypothetical protein